MNLIPGKIYRCELHHGSFCRMHEDPTKEIYPKLGEANEKSLFLILSDKVVFDKYHSEWVKCFHVQSGRVVYINAVWKLIVVDA